VPITPYWLRSKLRGLLEPAGSREWQAGTPTNRQHCRGYEKSQFADAWARYTPPPPLAPSPPSGTSGSTGTASPDTKQNQQDTSVPDRKPSLRPSGTADVDPLQQQSAFSAAHTRPDPDGPDVPDEIGGERGTHASDGEAPIVPCNSLDIGSFDDAVAQVLTVYPGWSNARVAKYLFRSPTAVARVRARLAGKDHPPEVVS
jgi:hypothetical protein